MKKEVVDAYASVAMPKDCEKKIRRAIAEKRKTEQKYIRRLHPVAAVLALQGDIPVQKLRGIDVRNTLCI